MVSVAGNDRSGAREAAPRSSSVRRWRSGPRQLCGAHQRPGLPRWPGPRVRTPTTSSRHPQTRVRARATPRAHVLRAQETGRAAASTEALQDRVHQGTHTTTAHRARHPLDPSERAEDTHLRAGEEARRAARDHDTHTGSDHTQQA